MRICIDARNLVFERKWAGTTLYTLRLVESLKRVAPSHEYTLYFNFFRGRLAGRVPRLKGLHVRTRVLRMPRKYADKLCDDYHFPIDLVTGPFDILHGPAYELLYHRGGRSVVSIPDLTFHLHPDWLGSEWREHFIQDVRSSLERADLFITISNFIKGEMIEHLEIPGEKIVVTHLGVEGRFTPHGADGERRVLINRYGLSRPYLLSVATQEPKKNLPVLLQAYRILADRLPDPPRLVLVGKRGWETPGIREEIDAKGLGRLAIVLGYATMEDLPRLYRHAEIFLFPSIYEGFGLPLLEAMASGCPVAASNAASIPEITGDAAVLFDPHDPEAMAVRIEEILKDRERRMELSQRGIERAKSFTWEETARKTLEAYKRLT